MLRAFVRGWQLSRLRALLVGVLFLGGLFVAVSHHEATSAAPPAADAKDAKAKGKAVNPKTPRGNESAAAVKWPEPLKLTVVAKSDEELSSLREMVSTINRLCEEKWKENKIVPSRYANNYEFIRRASLDIIGRIAKPEEIREFLKDPEDTRRSKLINRLLESDEYPRHWANLWANWLLSRSGVFGRGPYHEYLAAWLEDQFSQNKPYSSIVKSLITATGENNDMEKGGAAVNFILAHVGENVPGAHRGEEGQFQMVPLTSRITRLFLGTQVQCAQCHDHPFYGNLKQEHFWGINAFLRQVVREGQPPQVGRMMNFGKLTLRDDEDLAKTGLVYYEKRNGVILTARPEFLPSGDEKHGAPLPAGMQGIQRREKLAEFILDHPQFPKAIVNRMWGVFFGRGFVNPIDDFNDQNQPSNPELLDELAARLKHYNYDLKKLIRWMCNSNPYNLSCVANRTNDKPENEALFSRMNMKAMSPEQLFESLMVATKSEAAESKASKKTLRDQWLNTLINNFGDDEGNEVNFNGTVVQALMMMNGKDINDAIARKDKGAVALVIRKHTEKAAIQELYLTALNRPPTDKEVRTIYTQFALSARDPQVRAIDLHYPNRRYEDLFWALLNSNEFILNH
ncbi:MAG TPA: DUF1549 and DUF1553 domain-containing protein [Gemmataceae bacterium]|nr:DUF1549 and DUF1553 domain-containing protein [Gemmataceae bacterium]